MFKKLNRPPTGSQKLPDKGKRSYRLFGRLLAVSVLLATASYFAVGSNAASFSFIGSVSEFFGMARTEGVVEVEPMAPAALMGSQFTVTPQTSNATVSVPQTFNWLFTPGNASGSTAVTIAIPSPWTTAIGFTTLSTTGCASLGAITATTIVVNQSCNPSNPFTVNYTGSANVIGPYTFTTTGPTFTLGNPTVNVQAANTAPTITDIADTSTNEDTATGAIPFTVGDGETAAGSLVVTGSSSNTTLLPNANVVIGGSGANRTVTLTPAANLSGTTTITITVSDGVLSAIDTFVLTVNPVNDEPTLTDPTDVTINEDAGAQSVTLAGIGAGGGETQVLTVTATSSNPGLIPNPTVTYTSPGAGGSLGFTPVANQSGVATITVTVMDDGGTAFGGDDTVIQTFLVTVNAVNDEPTLTDPTDVTINEDAGAQSVTLAGIGAGGGETQVLTVTATSSNPGLIPNPTVTYTSPGAGGSLGFTPVANQSGVATITVTVMDDGGTAFGGDDTVIQTFLVTVNAVNDEPTLTDPTDVTINEDAGAQSVTLAGIGAGGGETQVLTVTATSSNPGLIPDPTVTYTSPGAGGSLGFTPVANQSGVATITVTVMDDGGTAFGGDDTVIQTFLVTVNAVNDEPTLTDPTDVTINEDAGAQSVTLAGIGAGGGETQVLTVTATSSNPGLIPNPTVTYTSPGAGGSLGFTPVANQSGVATITVTVMDDGGTAFGGDDTVIQTFLVTVNAVNDEPTLTDPTDVTINEDAGAQSVTLAGIGAGGGETQVLTVTATSSNPGLIPDPTVTYTSPGAGGSLGFTPVANQSGVATITVTVMDDGGTAFGGDDTVIQTFLVTVNAVNDEPTLTDPTDVTINEDAGAQSVTLAGIGAGGGETQVLTVTATSSNPGLIPNPTVTYTSPGAGGSLGFTPVANQSGVATITVTVMDDGGTAFGGDDTVIQTFLVTVNAVNDEPTLTDPTDVTINEDAGAQSVTLAGIGAGGGETQVLTVTATSSNPGLIPNPTVTYTSPGAGGSLGFTPVANQSGVATITVTVMDDGGTAFGGDDTVIQTFLVTVNAVNDEPTLTDPTDVTINEDAGAQSVTLAGIGAGGGETQVLTVTATSSNPGLIPNPTVTYTSPGAGGSLGFTPVANQSGVATITVTVMDDGGTAFGGDDTVIQTFTVTVNAVNDAPAGTDGSVTMNEDTAYTFVAGDFGFTDPNDTPANAFTGIRVASLPALGTLTLGGNPVNVGDVVSIGTLVFTPPANASGSPYTSFTFQVRDDGGTANTGVDMDQSPNTLTINVTGINDEPTLADPSDRAIYQNQVAQTVNLTGIGAGPGETQVLTVTATSDNPALIPNPTVTYTSPSATGSLSFMSLAGQSGTANITVTVTDDGGTANGGDNSVSQTFTVTVVPCPTISTSSVSSLTGAVGPGPGTVPLVVPVNTTALSNTTSPSIFAATFTFSFDATDLQFISAVAGAGAVNPGAAVSFNIPDPTNFPGVVVVGVASNIPLNGSGPLVFLNFNVIGPIGGTSPLAVTAFQFNEPLTLPVCSSLGSMGTLTILSGTVTGNVNYANTIAQPQPVPGVLLTADSTTQLADILTTTDLSGNYTLTGFLDSNYTVTPTKPNQTTRTTVFTSNDAARISQHVVFIAPLVGPQLLAADVTQDGTISSLDAAFVAQYIVFTANPLNHTGEWKFTPTSTTPNETQNSVQNYSAILLGDVNGSWVSTVTQPRTEVIDGSNAARSSVPTAEVQAGSVATVPFRIDNLRGQGVTSYQFDIEYDPAVVTPSAVAADVTDTLSRNLVVFSNAPTPGLLKVVVFGAYPVTNDGVYLNLRFDTIGGAGASTPLKIRDLIINDGEPTSVTVDGSLTLRSSASANGIIRGRVTTPTGQGLRNANVVLTSTTGVKLTGTTSSFGRFEFAGLAMGETYTVSVGSKRYRFAPQVVSVTAAAVELEMIAQE